ncbi:fungal-specific transcription factor domain-containing protein [Fusarium solani]|uniref:Fungal-specific transcription factor domain-containing protein n=1 Tax=Fusarium solani TaxID=169388 RepID=A0A9P9L7L5_FUSSL|nr:fungal-specific transcription factor domain-containing protein [Fusarium solani]KAH7275471.1 fungal-specific transcription factor domain-containing protein [Fusarium solani]
METRSSGTRSRHGCLTCRRRHRKCDEEKPACKVCRKTGRECEYGSDLKWATVGHASSFTTRHNKRTRENRARRRLGDSSQRSRTPSAASNQLRLIDNEPSTVPPNSTTNQNGDLGLDMLIPSAMGLTPWDDSVPELAWSSLIGVSLGADLLPEPFEPSFRVNTTDNNQEIEPEVPVTGGVGSIVSRPNPWSTKDSLGPLLSATLSSPSEEIAYTYYLNHTSSRIPAYDGPHNPYRKLCLVSVSYPLLLHTILYVSTVSMFNYGRSDSSLIAKHQSQASSLLQNATAFLRAENGNSGQEMPGQSHALSVLSLREVTLAAYLMHIVTEVMSGSQTAETFLQNAYQLMVELGYIESMPESYYARLLVHRFAIIDVVLAFLRRRKPIAPMSFVLYQQDEEMDQNEPSFRELTGCPQPVLAYLARISHLAYDAAAYQRDASSHLAEAYQLETEMRIWGQRYPVPFGPGVDQARVQISPADDRKDLDTLSECFYWTAQLLLARRVFLDPTSSPRVQFLRRHLFILMDRLPAGCGPDSSLPFPFYMAAREAMTSEDRDWVRTKHIEMINVYRDRSREIMMGLTEEIWSKADEAANGSVSGGHGSLVVLENDMYIHVLDTVASHFVF